MPINPTQPPGVTHESRLADRLATLEREIRTLKSYLTGGATQQVPVVTALPAAGRTGRLVCLSSDNKLYLDNGTAWSPQA